MSVTFYQSRLIDLLSVSNPTRLMKRVIDTLESNTEKVYIYDTNPTYAHLFLSDDTRTIYFYPNLQCSLLKPPDKPLTPHWNIWIDRTSVPPINLGWVHSILLLNAKERFESDKDILQEQPRTIHVSLVDEDNYIHINKKDTKTHLRINSLENTRLLKNIRTLQNMRLYKKLNLPKVHTPMLIIPTTPTPTTPTTPNTPNTPTTPTEPTTPKNQKEQPRNSITITQLFIPKLQKNTMNNRPKWK